MWAGSWGGVGRVLVSGAVAYVFLVVLLRWSGKRTLSKLNAFDLVVTVAMGSTLGSVVLSGEVPLAEGAAGFVILVLCQLILARASVGSGRFSGWVRSTPRLLLADGTLREEALVAERITRQEVLAALRQAGIGRIEDTGAVVLETDGSLSVLPRTSGPIDTLEGVKR